MQRVGLSREVVSTFRFVGAIGPALLAFPPSDPALVRHFAGTSPAKLKGRDLQQRFASWQNLLHGVILLWEHEWHPVKWVRQREPKEAFHTMPYSPTEIDPTKKRCCAHRKALAVAECTQ